LTLLRRTVLRTTRFTRRLATRFRLRTFLTTLRTARLTRRLATRFRLRTFLTTLRTARFTRRLATRLRLATFRTVLRTTRFAFLFFLLAAIIDLPGVVQFGGAHYMPARRRCGMISRVHGTLT